MLRCRIMASSPRHGISDSRTLAPASPVQVIVMAAGQGKRMRSARPKVLHPLAGRPLLSRVLDAARALSPAAIVVVVGQGGAEVEAALAANDLAFVTQEPPRGTGDAVRVALAVLPRDGVTVVVNGDCPLLPAQSLAALAASAAHGRLALLSARAADPSGLGRVVRDGNANVKAIVEERDATPAQRALDEIYTGVLAAPTALLASWVDKLVPNNAQDEYYLTDVVGLAQADGVAVEAQIAADPNAALGVNDRAQLAAIERILQRRRAEALMLAGTTFSDPDRVDIRGTLTCGRDVTIDIGCVFEGNVTLDEGASIGAYCVLRDVAVGAGTSVLPFCHLNGATLGANCIVGPYARMRPGTSLANEVHIGNFVEVKATAIGEGSKANHLAYLGDATIGRAVNVGAGTIICNYDGANKHHTVIEDEAFIGSDTQLVAPVTVGRGATLGAGTTLTKDAPPGALTVSRARQTTVAGWKRPAKKPRGSD